MSNWQEIGTAPKDGTWVIAAKESGWTVPRFPYPLKQRWNGERWEATDKQVYEPQPTHWRPIPTHPDAQEKGENNDQSR